MVKAECVNCTKSSYRGKGVGNVLHFGCNSPYCVKEPIVENPYHHIVIKELQNNGKNSRNN